MNLTRIPLHSFVRVAHQLDKDRGYNMEVREVRRQYNGLTGVAIAEHDSHGLCYEVEFPNGIVVTYDREELEASWRRKE